MSLKDKIQRRLRKTETVIHDGDEFIVSELSELDGGEILDAEAARTSRGYMQRLLLSECVTDSDGSKCSPDEWGDAPRTLTAALVPAIMRVNGYDREDIEKKD